jgi:hypothetical protein
MHIEEILYTQGFGTRRVCAGLIQQGFVTVDGRTVTDPGEDFATEGLHFTVQGKPWEYHEKAYVLLHKPAGTECSHAAAAMTAMVAIPVRAAILDILYATAPSKIVSTASGSAVSATATSPGGTAARTALPCASSVPVRTEPSSKVAANACPACSGENTARNPVVTALRCRRAWKASSVSGRRWRTSMSAAFPFAQAQQPPGQQR